MTVDEHASLPPLTAVPLVGVAVNAALATVKILAGFFGNSYALIADGIESTSDIVTSLIVWGGLRVAGTPADDRHPYGYGKAEALAGIVAGLALLGAAMVIAIQSIREIFTPHHLPHWSTLLVLVLVVGTKEALARWVGGIGDATDSTAQGRCLAPPGRRHHLACRVHRDLDRAGRRAGLRTGRRLGGVGGLPHHLHQRRARDASGRSRTARRRASQAV